MAKFSFFSSGTIGKNAAGTTVKTTRPRPEEFARDARRKENITTVRRLLACDYEKPLGENRDIDTYKRANFGFASLLYVIIVIIVIGVLLLINSHQPRRVCHCFPGRVAERKKKRTRKREREREYVSCRISFYSIITYFPSRSCRPFAAPAKLCVIIES